MCDLKEWFRCLTKDEKGELKKKFENSPVAGKLIEFLEHNIDRNFSNRDVIRHIYADEFSHDNLAKLNNRFAKLKKKVTDSISGDSQVEHLLTSEEQILVRARSFLENQKYLLARKLLVPLQKSCRQLQVLELLPEIISLRITVEQRIDPFNVQLHQSLSDQYIEAVEHEYQFRKLWHLITIGFNTNEAADEVAKKLRAVKQICSQFPSNPRFQSAYHYASILRGVDARQVKRANAISRHFNELERVLNENPGMPVLHYKPNHEYHTRLFSIPQLKAYHLYYRMDFEGAYQQIMQVKGAVGKSGMEEKVMASSEAFYMNEISFCIAAKRYQQALRVIEELGAFQRKQKKLENMIFCHLYKASVFVHAYPTMKCSDPDRILNELELFQKSFPSNIDDGFYASHFWTIAAFKLIIGKYDSAIETLNLPAVQSFLSGDNHQLMQDTFRCRTNRENVSSTLSKSVDKALFKTTRPGEHLAMQWAKQFIAVNQAQQQ